MYLRVSQKLARENGINSLRIRFRYSTDLEESILDILIGIEFLTQEEGITSIGMVGHSFGEAVVISTASIASENIIKSVITLATQSYGTEGALRLKEGSSCSMVIMMKYYLDTVLIISIITPISPRNWYYMIMLVMVLKRL